MAVMDPAALSRSLSKELESFPRQQESTRTVRRRFQQHGLSARRPWLRLPLTLHHRLKRFQWSTNADFNLGSDDKHVRVGGIVNIEHLPCLYFGTPFPKLVW
ncbi:hypothetical protein TNCV_3157641 [Trichonephila clavipes]|nr:hypothetical protein TNCV_3157641 [Trichonephila clavipes]